MAKATKTEATNASPATDQAAKPKRENLFSSGISADFKKKEAKLRFGFNIVGNKVKKLGLSAEAQTTIIDTLKKEFEAKSTELMKPSANPVGESFV
jgi:hypothetical protein